MAYLLLFNIFVVDTVLSKFVNFWEVIWNREDNKAKQSREQTSKLHASQQYEFQHKHIQSPECKIEQWSSCFSDMRKEARSKPGKT